VISIMAQPGVASASVASGGPEQWPAAGRVPALENGDRLTRYEFERRYAARPDLKKAQLIEGIVYMPSPVSVAHAGPHAMIQTVLLVYAASTPGVQGYDNATVRLDLDNEPQPDVVLLIGADAGGRCRVSEDNYLEGAPELVVEVAASSASIDLHAKRRAYRRNGVQEYVVWRTQEQRIDWFELADGEYRPLPADDAGILHSRVFLGLRLAAGALLKGDLAGALAEVQKGVGTPEHQAFVARLAERGSSG
jgi:Uma2 family endonuclease